MLHAEKMHPEDFPFAVQLANTMEWGMAKADFAFMLGLEPDGCFVLFDDTERVGIATCISYGKTGWFGNLVVKEKQRRKGAGTFLVRHAVEYLRDRGVESVGLYAYPHLTGFYQNASFKANDDLVVLGGKAVHDKTAGLREVTANDIPALVEFASQCLGGDRQKLLRALIDDADTTGYLVTHNSEIAGYALVKVYGGMAEIGPLLCKRHYEDAGDALLKSAFSKTGSLEAYAYVPLKEERLLKTLKAAGFKEAFRLKRMYLGRIPAEHCVYMPESLERG
jgi:ribosomal protein S18 acetylase RimI-like enzyme